MASVIRGSDNMDSADVEAGRAKAWVNFNGTGTVAIRASYNVSSITDSAAGRYVANLSITLADTNYIIQSGVAGTLAAPTTGNPIVDAAPSSTSAVLVQTQNPTSNAAADFEMVCIGIHR